MMLINVNVNSADGLKFDIYFHHIKTRLAKLHF